MATRFGEDQHPRRLAEDHHRRLRTQKQDSIVDQIHGGATFRDRRLLRRNYFRSNMTFRACICRQQLSHRRFVQVGPLHQCNLCGNSIFRLFQLIRLFSLQHLEKPLQIELSVRPPLPVEPLLVKLAV